jgi:threonine/homoserine/homoserine lactone efflux protein
MTIIMLVLTAFALGFLIAIPVGAVQIEIAKRALNRKFLAAIMVALGAVTSDVGYGAIAVFGIAPFLRNSTCIAIFESVSVLILWVLAFHTFREAGKADEGAQNTGLLKSKRFGFLTGLGIAVANPMMVFWWLLGMRFAINSGLIESFTRTLSLLFLFSGGLGVAAYLLLLVAVLYKVRKFVSGTSLKKGYKIMGYGLLLLSFYFLYHAVRHFKG